MADNAPDRKDSTSPDEGEWCSQNGYGCFGCETCAPPFEDDSDWRGHSRSDLMFGGNW